MGPLPVLVSPCFRENVVVTCKIGSFLCSLDNLLQKKQNKTKQKQNKNKNKTNKQKTRNCFLFSKSNFKMALIWKRAIFDLLFTFFSHQGMLQKLLRHIYHSHTYMYFAHPIDFFALQIWKKNTNLPGMISLWCDSWCWFLFAPFWNKSINNKIVSKT